MNLARRIVLAGLVVGLASPSLFATNRFYIDDVTVVSGSTGNVAVVRGEFDQETYALSIYLEYDESKITVTSVEFGTDVDSVSPEFADGEFSNADGTINYGVLFDTSDPVTKHMAAGADQELLVITFDAAEIDTTTLQLNLVDRNGPPPRLNVMADVNGDTVSPSPQLSDATVTIDDLKPIVDNVSPNAGEPDDVITITGSNFDEGNLTVAIGGRDADITVNGNEITVTVPPCATADGTGPADVVVCTDRGCTTIDNGFSYDSCGPVPPLITEIISNTGMAGRRFFISGSNFNEDGLRVEVCGVDAEFSLTGLDLVVTAPSCADTGWVPVMVCTDIGCDTEAQGFFYEGDEPTGLFIRGDINNDLSVDISDPIAQLNELFSGVDAAAPCDDARDINDDGNIDISDPIYGLQALFAGGAPIPPPNDVPGEDPTPDDLPGC